LDYFDLYLIHSPIGGENIKTYQALVDLQGKGKIKSIGNKTKKGLFFWKKGVSNYGVAHLQALEKAGLPLPAVNQIELHPWLQQKEIVKHCRSKGIVVEAYSPLTKGQMLKKPNQHLQEMSGRYKKSVPQLLIKWSLQKGYVCIVKSSNEKRIQENFDMWGWDIDNKDIEFFDGLNENFHCTWDPTNESMDNF
ncbi:hypothetical protein RFI_04394, partial [Reticulomyxa filosa]